ncbi:RNB domain-containing ribonuclease [Prochlorococcus sp.]|jgi:ribonuclease R|uniref:RNB domain-containing ribonuclease n=1 Tax=Prochlorococcus sp. TaxID=1220 RepID=UPI003F6A3F5D
MFSTSSIIENLNQEEGLEYKKLCRLLNLSKKTDKAKLDIALRALEELEIINKNKDNEYFNVKESNHLIAKIRCSSKGYCFAVRENNNEDIYIKENLLNYAWNGDKVLVRIIKDGVRRRSPEGVVDCILERTNQILLAKVEIIKDEVFGIPIDDRILAKIKLPKKDEKYKYNSINKNIVKIEIDLFPIAQQEGIGHVIKELTLNNNEKLDTDFVLSKSNIHRIANFQNPKLTVAKQQQRLDLSSKNSYMFKSWETENSPILPIFQIEKIKNKTYKLWIHTNTIAERLDLSNKKSLQIFFDRFESFPLLEKWQNYLSDEICNAAKFNINEINDAISLCIEMNSENEIINWSFHLTKVKCSLLVENQHIDALLTRKSKARITSRILKPIKDYIEDLDKIIEISNEFRKKQLLNGKIELPKSNNNIESLKELLVHNPADFSKEYFEPLNNNDIQTYLTPLLYEANSIWFNHSNNYGLNNASYISQKLDYINVTEIIKNSELIDSNIELNDNGTLSFKKLVELCTNDNKKRILHKILFNVVRDNDVTLISKDNSIDDSKNIISPWTLPSFDFTNLINQYNIYNMIINGKRNKNSGGNLINIMERESWENVNWRLYNSSIIKSLDLLFNNVMIDKINEYKDKVRQFKSNMITIKKIRKAEKFIGNKYSGLIMAVQSYGFFVEIPELYVEGLVHVSTLSNDWYEYRSRQNSLIGRKSKNSYKIGDEIDIKIIKVDILKYQIDLEIV